ncbi:hypothetical protein OCAE111667_19950 [Occultella aeris]|uniref:DUF4386 family protein n=1 Tax=Occultella aeris TaxID=2761496 RepID=A0A7M4DJP3_9MICO|nr:hypothetical protein [Occultella aeris]VZO37263.1 hypothetical protein HALOF300_02350 [Occultella aeris]
MTAPSTNPSPRLTAPRAATATAPSTTATPSRTGIASGAWIASSAGTATRTSRAPTFSRAALAVAGVLFVLYPAVRPWTDETTLAGAAAFASQQWVAAHTMGMFAFMLVAAALLVRAFATGRALITATLAAVGTALVLPYYGAETFGLHAIGLRAVADRDESLLELADTVRYGPVPMTMFGLGLLALAAAGILLARDAWRAGGLTRAGGLLTGLMLALYLPQFFGTPAMRIGHGALLAIGCILLAIAWGRAANGRATETR